MIVIIYVNDLIILASNMTKLMEFKAKLEKEFDMSDLRELRFFLGVQIKRNRGACTFTMHQKSYIEGVLSHFGMEKCKPLATPLDVKATLVKPSQEELKEFSQEMDRVPYKAVVSSLMYAMVATQANLAFAVSVVTQFMASPAPLHWMAVKRIMGYLKGTLDVKLCLEGTNMSLHGYCDVDWGGDLITCKSTMGYLFFVGDGAISWNSKRQPIVALSTTEAEYMAASHLAKEAMWLRLLMADVGCMLDGATTVKCDNQGCIALVKNPKHHSRTKHIDVRHHFIHEAIEDNIIELEYCPTKGMVADVLTKALARECHVMLTKAMELK